MENFIEQALSLKHLYEKEEIVSKLISEKKKEFEESIKELVDQKKLCVDNIEFQKEVLNKMLLEENKLNGTKKFDGGFEIKEFKNLVYDEQVAFDFAKEKQMFIQFDKKAFDKVAESLNLDFVEIKKEPKVTFPKTIKLEG